MNKTTRRCTKCGETKPITEFRLNRASEPDGRRRTDCRACEAAAHKARSRLSRSVYNQIFKHSSDPSYQLSPEADALVYTEKPIDPDILAAYKKRQANQRAAERRRPEASRETQELRQPPVRGGDAKKHLAQLTGSKPIVGSHNEDHRFPYATLADQLDDRAGDHFALHVNRKPLWVDGGKMMARRIVSASKLRREAGG